MGTTKLILAFCVISLCHGEGQLSCNLTKPSLKIDGDVVITGLLDLHNGSDCNKPITERLQQMTAAGWTVHRLNELEYIHEFKIGLVIYDICSLSSNVAKAAATAMVEEGLLDCKDKYNLGLVTTSEIANHIESLTEVLEIPLTIIPQHQIGDLFNASFVVLQELNWTSISIIVSKESAFKYLREYAVERGICIQHQITFASLQNSNILSKSKSAIVVIGTVQEVEIFLQYTKELHNRSILIVSPSKDIEKFLMDNSDKLPKSALILRRRNSLPDKTTENLRNMELSPFFLYSDPEVVGTILRLAQHLKTGGERNCSSTTSTLCEKLTPAASSASKQVQVDEMATELQVSLPEKGMNTYILFHANRQKNYTVYLHEVGTFSNEETGEKAILWTSDRFPEMFANQCSECTCKVTEQRIPNSLVSIQWRHESWIAACVSISALGTLCSIVVIIFITVRIYKGDVLEGNPGFSFILLFSIIFMYCTVLPFGLEGSQLFCTLRYLGTTMSYAVVFSVIVARSLLLAFCDNGGFMSHINGYLQTALYIFIVGVQIGLSIQFWAMNSEVLFEVQGSNITCTIRSTLMILSLTYDMFLLVILLCICPFIVRSKRNYQEGMFFTITAGLSFILWIAWSTCYMLLPTQWQDASIVAGLTSTATVALVSIFIPRTYAMMSGIVRDELTSVLPPINQIPSASIMDLNYRGSNNALYDSISHLQRNQQITSGIFNPNYYSEAPVGCKYRSSESTPENTYARYDSPPSPDKVTHL